jgi:hypothetical protein
MTTKDLKLNDNAKAWYALAKDMRIKEEEIVGASFVFACINTMEKLYHDKDILFWMINSEDYDVEKKTTLSDKYKIDGQLSLSLIYLFNEVIFKVGFDDYFKDDRENSNKDGINLFLSRDYNFLPEINKNNYNYSLSIAHNFYTCLFYKISLLLKDRSFKDAYELGVFYSFYMHNEDPLGFANFFDLLHTNAPPIFKFLWSTVFMNIHVGDLNLKNEKKYLPFQAALHYILGNQDPEVSNHIWQSQSFMFYKNTKLLYPERQWLEMKQFINESAIAIENHYESMLAIEGPDFIESIRSKIKDKYIYKGSLDEIIEFFDKLLFDDYKFNITDYTANDSYSLQQRACIFMLLSLIKTKNLLMSNQNPDVVH